MTEDVKVGKSYYKQNSVFVLNKSNMKSMIDFFSIFGSKLSKIDKKWKPSHLEYHCPSFTRHLIKNNLNKNVSSNVTTGL